jgi:Tol biopolymer transport system component
MEMKRISILIVALLIVPLSSGIYASQSLYDLFQKALVLERADGKLQEAISLYQKLVDESGDRSLAAKAQLHIGMCYEKLGLTEAQKAYQGLIDSYPEQLEEVALARERIAELARASNEALRKPTIRRIQVPIRIDEGAQLSPDGKKLTFSSERYEGSIWEVPVPGKVSPDIAGESTKLTGDLKAWGWGHAWSADGKWIAFNELKDERDVFVDRAIVIPAAGGTPQRIPLSKNRGGGFNLFQYCLSLSPDGKVLAFSSREGDKSYIYTTPVRGGTPSRLTEPGTWQPAFSPDGKKIAYVRERTAEDNGAGSDIWVIPATGGESVQVSHLLGRAMGPVWSPDGKRIAFHRAPDPEIYAGQELWIVPVSERGEPTATPTKIDQPLQSGRLVGWTPDNKIGLLLRNQRHKAIYTVPSTGGKATQVTPDGASWPSWSADGERIFYQSAKPEYGISSVPAGGGTVSHVPIDAGPKDFSSYNSWYSPKVSPNGESIVFPAQKEGSAEVHLWTVPIQGGQARQLTTSPGTDLFPNWSSDGKFVLFARQVKSGESYTTSIYLVSAEGGQPRELASFDAGNVRTTAWSPDGKSITYVSDHRVWSASIEGGERRILAEAEPGQRVGSLAWSPGGDRFAYSNPMGIFVFSVEEGKTTKLETGLEGIQGALAWSPDGQKIAFAGGRGGDFELWLMEDFLHLVQNNR